MRRLSFFILFFAIMNCGPNRFAAAGDPSLCVITIASVELKDRSGRWITVINPDRQVDLVNEDAGLSFFNNGRIPAGEYVNFKVRLLPVFKVSGEDGGRTTAVGGDIRIELRALPAGGMEISSWKEFKRTLGTAPAGPVHVRLGGSRGGSVEITSAQDLTEPLRVSEGSFIGVWFKIPLQGTLSFRAPGIMVFVPPSALDEVSVTIDDVERILSRDQILIRFPVV